MTYEISILITIVIVVWLISKTQRAERGNSGYSEHYPCVANLDLYFTERKMLIEYHDYPNYLNNWDLMMDMDDCILHYPKSENEVTNYILYPDKVVNSKNQTTFSIEDEDYDRISRIKTEYLLYFTITFKHQTK